MVNDSIEVAERIIFTKVNRSVSRSSYVEVIVVDSHLLHGSWSIEPHDHALASKVESRDAVEVVIGPGQVTVHPEHGPAALTLQAPGDEQIKLAPLELLKLTKLFQL